MKCPCLRLSPPPLGQIGDLDYFELQQEFLTNVSNSNPLGSSCSAGKSNTSPPTDFILRILPLGASIVWGEDSSDGNGFRDHVRQSIIDDGGSVNYVGSKQNGQMFDNDLEATPGDRIDQIAVKAELSLPYLPNLVIIHAGTNDCIQEYDTANAPNRLGTLIDRITSAIPGVVVLVSTLIPNLNAAAQSCIDTFNSQLPSVIQDRQNAGQLVVLVDMEPTITTGDLNTGDGTHPTDDGYVKMATVWEGGLQTIFSNCWLSAPGDSGIPDTVGNGSSTTCQKVPGNAMGPIRKYRPLNKGFGLTDICSFFFSFWHLLL